MKPKVSVVMPVKNPEPAWAREAIESVLSQSMPDLELIIVEDPSARSVREIVAGVCDDRVTNVLVAQRPSPLLARTGGPLLGATEAPGGDGR